MLQLRQIVLRGQGVTDASIKFLPGGNIVAGESDTGKSYLLRCLDYIFGADEMKKRIPAAESYSTLYVQFQNKAGDVLTLERHLSGGDLASHTCAVEDIQESGKPLKPKRTGKSKARDVTEVLFQFAGLSEAVLRKNDRGEVQRLTIRQYLPVFLVDEIAIIDERSPVLGKGGFDETPRKRMFAHMLTGKDDTGVIAAEKSEIAQAKLTAQLGLITGLLEPVEHRIQQSPRADEDSIEKVDFAIAELSASNFEITGERAKLQAERTEETRKLNRAESQVVAADELLARYHLLEDRYDSDLQRLDFVTEGAHFFNGLQEVACPLCEQPMTSDHAHTAQESVKTIYESAKAEASKILGQRGDLALAIKSLENIRSTRLSEVFSSKDALALTDQKIMEVISPALQETAERLEVLMARRIELERQKADEDQACTLRLMRDEIERMFGGKPGKSTWEDIPSTALRALCREIEAVLTQWEWKGEGRVEFDQKEFDIIVDGQSRQSHGKGVRAVLHAAFTIGLLRFCKINNMPHPGVVVIDSPLTSYKKGKPGGAKDGPIDAGMESAFWRSLTAIDPDIQVIVVENKEPPAEVANGLTYYWFAGDTGSSTDRKGFIPAV
ncbi:hypothetical protein B8W72_28475 [Pseudomonas putida]|uniref:Rad50/SbcC-type AAA domain-containing protein n=1 Tax=Pseudomonas putida TaxID=303 RepID=A0A1Y3KDC4_PSEPU|nr:hypothetical protein [Pseudomonas putida]OUM23837.1 hypothetical protein B8W72_28475 [Pseudomonas putida]